MSNRTNVVLPLSLSVWNGSSELFDEMVAKEAILETLEAKCKTKDEAIKVLAYCLDRVSRQWPLVREGTPR